MKAVKFGGSSLCDARAIQRAEKIVRADPCRRFVTVSAPGKRFSGDVKITDMLYECFESSGDDFLFSLEKIKARFDEIISDLKIGLSLDEDFSEMVYGRKNYFGRDYFASRGEYFCAKIFSACLGFDFVDASELIAFDERGNFLSGKTGLLAKEKLSMHKNAVVPGFYGSMPGGTIKTFSRGGSDVTGAIVAASVGADIYENFTDVAGFMSADPKTVDNPKKIDIITYKELRCLSYMGAGVLHEDAVLPLREAGIPVVIKSTLNPSEPGTTVVGKRSGEGAKVCGIAGRDGFVIVFVGKNRIGSNPREVTDILDIFTRRGICVFGIYSCIDCLGFAVRRDDFSPRADYLRNEICQYTEPDFVTLGEPCALVAIVGAAPEKLLSQIFSAVDEAGARVLCVDSGAGDGGVTVGVPEKTLPAVLKSLYGKLIR